MSHKDNKKQPNVVDDAVVEDAENLKEATSTINSDQSIIDDEQNTKLTEMQNKYLRVLADYQNLNKRLDEDRISIVMYANEKLISKLLPIYDDLQRASEHINDSGLVSVIDNFKKLLAEFNVSKMEIELSKTDFDGNLHEAIESCEGDENKIMKLYRNGYTLNGRVIQAAVVAVGSKSNS